MTNKPLRHYPTLATYLGWLVVLCCYSASLVWAADHCERDHTAVLHQIKRVIDADTLELENGQRVRLIGIDAPELGRRGSPDEPFAREGKLALQQQLNELGNRLWVQLGEEPYDRCNRLLADLFFEDGQSVQAWLLQQGWVMQVFFAQNARYADCLQRFEQEARLARRGIWSLGDYDPGIASTAVPDSVQGAVIIRGKVDRVGRSEANLWLNLEGGVAIQIPRRHLSRFSFDPAQLEGKTVRVRGWIISDQSRHHQWRIRIDDHRAVEVL